MRRAHVLTACLLLLSVGAHAQRQEKIVEAFKKASSANNLPADSGRLLEATADTPVNPLAQKALESFTAFEIYQEEAYRIALNTDPTQMVQKLDTHLARFKARVLESADPVTARVGASMLLRVHKQLVGDGASLKALADELVARYYEPKCTGYVGCSGYLKDLSELADIVPFRVRQKISTFKREYAAGSDLASRVLEYRAESLDIAATFNDLSQLTLRSERGFTPRLPKGQREQLRQRLQAAERAAASWRVERTGAELESNYLQRLRALYLELGGLTAPATMSEGEVEVVNAMARDTADSFLRVRQGNESLYVYLERVDTNDIGLWLKDIAGRVNSGALDRTAMITMFLRFSDRESYLPWRAEWARTAESLLAAKSDVTEGFRPAVDTLKSLVASRNAEIRARLTVQALGLTTAMDQATGETFAQRLILKEKALAGHFPLFSSLFRQLDRMDDAQRGLADAAARFDEIEKKSSTDVAVASLENARDELAGHVLVATCYALTTTPFPARLPDELQPQWSDTRIGWWGQGYELLKACASAASPSEAPALEQHVWTYVHQRRIDAVRWGAGIRVGTDIGTTLLAIPIVVGSFGAGEVAAKAASMAVTEWGTVVAARMAANRLVTLALTKALPRIAYMASGALTFSVCKRVGYAIFQVKPIYNPKVSLYENYGLDLLFGSVGYFYYSLKYYEGVAKAVSYLQSTRIIAGSPVREQFTYYAIGGLMDSIPFYLTTLSDRVIRNYLRLTNDPVIKDWASLQNVLWKDPADVGKTYASNWIFSTGYRLLWTRIGPWMGQTFPTIMTHPNGTSGPIGPSPTVKWLQKTPAAKPETVWHYEI